MAYMVLSSGYCTGADPATSPGYEGGGLRMYWELRFYTSSETPTIGGRTYSCPAGSYRLYHKLQGWYGVQISGNIRLVNRIGQVAAAYVALRNGTTDIWVMGTQGVDYASQNPSFGSNNPPNTWRDVADASAAGYQVYPEGILAVSQGATLSLNLSYYVGLYYDNSHKANASATSASTTVVVTGGQSAIASLPASVLTNDTLTLGVTRYNSAYWHKATFKVGGTTLFASDAFETSLGFTVPRSWFNSYTSTASLTVTVEMQTYTDQSCTTAVGTADTRTITVNADAGMAPTLDVSFATVAADNTGTAASGIVGFVEGYTKAKLRLTKNAVTTANGASVASYDVSCQGNTATVTGPDATEDVLTGTLTGHEAVSITILVTDSRGLTASTTLQVTPMAYAPPTLSSVDVFRCNISGTASADGTYYSAKATGGCSSLNSQNSVSLKAAVKAKSDPNYGAGYNLQSGVARVLGSGMLDPDTTYMVKVTATDSLGNETAAVVTLPLRKWAMKFRSDGEGVAFGKAPEYGQKKLELPSDWEIMFGSTSLAQRILAGRPTLYYQSITATTDPTGNIVLGSAFDDRPIINVKVDTPLIVWAIGTANLDSTKKMLHFWDYTGATKANTSITFTVYWFEESDFQTQQVT